MEIISGRQQNPRSKKSSAAPLIDMGKLQPQARDLEEAVLGALMLEKDAYPVISDILKPESFYEYKHQLIYKAIVDLAMKQEPIDMLTVCEQLRRIYDYRPDGARVVGCQRGVPCPHRGAEVSGTGVDTLLRRDTSQSLRRNLRCR